MKVLAFFNKDAGYESLKYLMTKNVEIKVITTEYDYNIWKSVEELAKFNSLDVKTPITLKDKNIIEEIKEFNPDMMFSIFYDKIIPKEILELTGVRINIHGGNLPKYKGCRSNMWTIINNEKVSACTAHCLEENIDEGKILAKLPIPIDKYETGYSLYYKTTDTAIELFKIILDECLKGGRNFRAMNQIGEGHYYTRDLPYNGIIKKEWSKEKKDRVRRAFAFPPFENAKEE